MVTHLKSPWGIPANYREMEGSGVNTYKLVNDQGEAVLCKFHWIPKQGVRNLTSAQASEIQAKDVGHATRDLYDNIEAGNFPEWEFAVQIMPDGPNDHLSFDPLDDTKLWPVDQFPLLP
ncbi:MAG: catalase, partial [Xanthomonas perforans]|nr:catalase [Xanthomonas perforans]